MKAVLLKEFGGVDQLYIGTTEDPDIGPNDVLVKVEASALNRADTLQRRGLYPPPPGASEIIGLEMSGVITQVGTSVTTKKIGDRVCGLLAGGGYAQYVSINEHLALPIPGGLDFLQAAAIPEVFLTAFQALVLLADLKEGERVLIHAGASGVGTAAIQLAKKIGASQIIVTASKGKHELCLSLGADHAIDYKSEDFESAVSDLTDGQGVDVVIDFLAASYFQKNINSMGFDGRMVMLALMGGVQVESLQISNILFKRLKIMGSTLRARSLDYKIDLAQSFYKMALPSFIDGSLSPIIDSVYDWSEVAAAHTFMEANKNAGKIILKIS